MISGKGKSSFGGAPSSPLIERDSFTAQPSQCKSNLSTKVTAASTSRFAFSSPFFLSNSFREAICNSLGKKTGNQNFLPRMLEPRSPLPPLPVSSNSPPFRPDSANGGRSALIVVTGDDRIMNVRVILSFYSRIWRENSADST